MPCCGSLDVEKFAGFRVGSRRNKLQVNEMMSIKLNMAVEKRI